MAYGALFTAMAAHWVIVYSCRTITTLAASSGKRIVFRSDVRQFVCPDFFVALIVHTPHTQRDSAGGSTRRGQRTFPSEWVLEGRTYWFRNVFSAHSAVQDHTFFGGRNWTNDHTSIRTNYIVRHMAHTHVRILNERFCVKSWSKLFCPLEAGNCNEKDRNWQMKKAWGQ